MLTFSRLDDLDRLQVPCSRASNAARVVPSVVEAGVAGPGQVGDQTDDRVAHLVVLQERAEAGQREIFERTSGWSAGDAAKPGDVSPSPGTEVDAIPTLTVAPPAAAPTNGTLTP